MVGHRYSVYMGSAIFMYAVLIILPLLALPVLSQDCLVGDLGPVADTFVNKGCNESFNGSVQIPAGLACYTGLAPGSLAEYYCNCPQYGLEGSRTRVCQDDGTWSGSVPQCLPQCDDIPNPLNEGKHFVGPVDCSPDTLNVTATYSCGLYRDNRMIQFNTTDGNCQWPDPPCEVRFATSLCTTGAGFYGSIMINIFILVIALLVCYKPNKIFIPLVLVVTLILPPVGLVLAWWLVHEKVPAVSALNENKSFTRKWWRAILVVVGSTLWLICFICWIAVGVIFIPRDALPSSGDYNLLIAGFSFTAFSMVYWIVAVNLLCRCRRPRPAASDEAYCSHFGGQKKPQEIAMGQATQEEYGGFGKEPLWKPENS